MSISFPALLFLALQSFGSAQTQKISVEITPPRPDVVWSRLERLPLTNPERAAQLKLRSLFVEAGCQDHLDEKVRGSKLPNVVCTLAGDTEQTIVVGAHYDKVKREHGAVDNWSGAALMASLYEALSKRPRTDTFRFVGFSDEE
jgi:hypothetical protein